MAFISTYISAVSGGSELSSYFEEVAEWSSTADVSAHELAIKESYDYLNSKLDAHVSIPVQKELTTARYPAIVRRAQAKIAIAMMKERKRGMTEAVADLWTEATKAITEVIENKAQFDFQYSPDEIGIQQPIAGTSNTSTARLLVDVKKDFSGDLEQTYTVTAASTGAVETATYSWSDGEGNSHTGYTSDYDWQALENNVYIRWLSGNIVSGDTWTIRCIPLDEVQTSGGGISMIPLRK
jgi:hypothetical protein